MINKNILLATVLASSIGIGATTTAAFAADDMKNSHKGHHGQKHEGKKGGKHHKGGKHNKGKRNSMKRIVKALELTEAQQTQIKAFREASKEKAKSLREADKTIREQMKTLDPSSEGYDAAVAAAADKKASLVKTQFIQRAEAKKQFLSILTDEQKAKLEEMKTKRESRKKGKGHKKHDRKHEDKKES